MEELELYKLSYYLPHVIECVADDGFRGVHGCFFQTG